MENKAAHQPSRDLIRCVIKYEMAILSRLISSFAVVNLHFTPFKTDHKKTQSTKKKQKVDLFQPVKIFLLLWLSITFDSHPLQLVSTPPSDNSDTSHLP